MQTLLIPFVAKIQMVLMPRKRRTKTINPVDDGTKQHTIEEYGSKEPVKIILKEIKPES